MESSSYVTEQVGIRSVGITTSPAAREIAPHYSSLCYHYFMTDSSKHVFQPIADADDERRKHAFKMIKQGLHDERLTRNSSCSVL